MPRTSRVCVTDVVPTRPFKRKEDLTHHCLTNHGKSLKDIILDLNPGMPRDSKDDVITQKTILMLRPMLAWYAGHHGVNRRVHNGLVTWTIPRYSQPRARPGSLRPPVPDGSA